VPQAVQWVLEASLCQCYSDDLKEQTVEMYLVDFDGPTIVGGL
jgi:hypothetical protein